MEYDVLALNIGSQTRELPFLQQGQEEEEEEGEGAHAIIATRPIGKLLNKVERWEQQRQQQQRNNDDMKDEVVIVGGGAAGVELAWALQARFQKNQLRKINVTLIDNKVALLQHEMGERVSKAVTAEMHRRGIRCLTAVEVTAVLPSPSKTIHLSDGTSLPFDLLKGGKEKQTADEGEKKERWTDDRGFLRVKKTLQALVGMPKGNVFAAGDCCSIDGYEWVAKAGVYAVREGPILAENIIRYLRNQELKEYEPQKSFLALLMTGDGRAIASWKGFAWTGTMPWRLKHKIDTTFMHSFQVQHLPPSPFQREAEHDAEEKETSVT
ncbi:Selenide, water dikinase SelD [Balamuthia mandrillaris]